MIDWSALDERLRTDPEFQLSSRHWTATLRLDVGEHSRSLRFEEGTLAESGASDAGAEADVFIRASEATWRELLALTPRPFYQDLVGAQIHHGVELPRDQVAYAAYYPALRRLVQLMSASRTEGSA